MPDYTKMRVSKAKRIGICPKCGRKGKYRHEYVDQKRQGYRAEWDSYHHVSEITFMGFESITEHCTVNYQRTPLKTGEIANADQN